MEFDIIKDNPGRVFGSIRDLTTTLTLRELTVMGIPILHVKHQKSNCEKITRNTKNVKALSQERVKELLRYNPMTGDFIWLVSRGKAKKGYIAGHVSAKDGYRRINVDQSMCKSSRLAWFYMLGYWPEHDVDHIDRDRANDKWSNLRHVSRICNMRNKDISPDNKTGVVGIFRDNNRKKWMSYINVNGKRLHLGRFVDFKKAVIARWNAEKKYHFTDCKSASSAYKYLKKQGEIS